MRKSTIMIVPKTERGFTLIELLIAVAIVALLAAIALPSYQEHIRKGRRAEGKSALLKTIQLQERNYTANGTYTLDLGPLYGLGAGATVRSAEDPADVGGWYTITADDDGGACPSVAVAGLGTLYRECIRLVATPRFEDTRCNVLTLTSRGVQGVTSGTETVQYCWR